MMCAGMGIGMGRVFVTHQKTRTRRVTHHYRQVIEPRLRRMTDAIGPIEFVMGLQ